MVVAVGVLTHRDLTEQNPGKVENTFTGGVM